jgi:hypothetical protein
MRSCKFYFILVVMMMTGTVSMAQWKTLFNGRDLKNWDTWLRATTDSGYSGPYHEPLGLNNDPLHVFTVHDGMLHVSGEVWGAVTYKEDFGNYQLRFQTKWGEKKYAPKDKLARDGGVLFHCTEGFDYAFNCWMRSMEMQVQEGEIGDFFNVGGGDAEAQFTKGVKTIYNETADQYDASEPLVRHPGRIWRSGNFESPKAEWTTCDLIARHSDAIFIVNGFVVNRLFNIYRKDLGQQVTHGKIQFQSEGAEQFYKKIQIRPISFTQTRPKLTVPDTTIILSANNSREIEITNSGEAVEIVAAELIGKNIEQFIVKLPALPLILKKGGRLVLRVKLKDGLNDSNKVKFRLETVLGPVEGFSVSLISK